MWSGHSCPLPLTFPRPPLPTLMEQNTPEFSPGGANEHSPALQRWVKWEDGTSPGGTAYVLTHTRKGETKLANYTHSNPR